MRTPKTLNWVLGVLISYKKLTLLKKVVLLSIMSYVSVRLVLLLRISSLNPSPRYLFIMP